MISMGIGLTLALAACQSASGGDSGAAPSAGTPAAPKTHVDRARPDPKQADKAQRRTDQSTAALKANKDQEPVAALTAALLRYSASGTVLGVASRLEAALREANMPVQARVNLIEPRVYQVGGGGLRVLTFKWPLTEAELKAQPDLALELPSRIVVHQPDRGKTQITLRDPQTVLRRFLPERAQALGETLNGALTQVGTAATD
ncbi:MAG: hypothetical protein ACPGUV_02170 [Polyangiales bacterium]